MSETPSDAKNVDGYEIPKQDPSSKSKKLTPAEAEYLNASRMADITWLTQSTEVSTMDVLHDRAIEEDQNHQLDYIIQKARRGCDVKEIMRAHGNNPQVVVAAVSFNGENLALAHPDMQRSIPVVVAGLRSAFNKGMAYKHAHPDLQVNVEIAATALRENPAVYQHFSDEVKYLPTMEEMAVKGRGTNLEHVSEDSKDTPKIVTLAVRDMPSAMQYASKRLRGYDFDHFEEATAFILGLIPKVNNPAEIFKHIDPDLFDNQKFMDEAVTLHPSLASFAAIHLKEDRDFARTMVNADVNNLSYVSKKLRASNGFMMEIVAINGEALKWCNSKQQKNEDIVIEAVGNHPPAAHFMHERLKSKKSFIRHLLKLCPEALPYIGPLNQDPEMILIALQQDGNAANGMQNEVLEEAKRLAEQ